MAEKTPVYLILFIVLLSLIISLSIAEWVLSYQKKIIAASDRMDPGMILYDDLLGWRLKPYWTGEHHHFDYDVSYTINREGFRGRASSMLETGTTIIGDSFTFGLGVNDDETFVSLLDTETSSNHRPYHNYSVPGYSTDQQLLLLKKLPPAAKQHVVLILYLGNDVFDNMRAYPLQADHGKPYFRLTDAGLSLQNTPVPLIAKSAVARKETISDIVLGKENSSSLKASWFSHLELSRRLGLFQSNLVLTEETLAARFSQSLALMSALIDALRDEVSRSGGELEIVLLPGRSFVESSASLSAQYQDYFRRYIIMSLENNESVDVLDLATHLRTLNDSGIGNLYYPNEGHLTALGHRYVADYLSGKINPER